MKKIRLVYRILFVSIFSFIIVLFSFYVYAFITPKFPLNSENNIVILDSNEENIFENDIYNNYVKIENISPYVIDAMVSVEDKNFFNHDGFDYLRIAKALYNNITTKKIVEGASTISQQYIKNLYLTFDKTWKRKLEEAYLTFELETHYTKSEILEGYLNSINFGAGNIGIKKASSYYFDKNPSELTIEEATLLVGIPKNPTYYNPMVNFTNAKKRQNDVLESMVNNNIITKKEKKIIYEKEIKLFGKRNNNYLSSLNYYKDATIKELSAIKGIPSNILDTEGLIVYTNLDKVAQYNLETNVKKYTKDTKMEIASIVINPKNGKIIALIGGKNYDVSEYNRAVNSKRQVGSTIKPFLYYSALENSFTPSTQFLSERTTFNVGDNTYSPKNYGNRYANKQISLLSAIAYSDNIYAMKTHLFLGTEELSKITKKAGIKTEIENLPSSALGTSSINMIDYSNGYITLANEGKSNSAHIIEKITDKKGKILYEHKYKEDYVLNKKYVYILNNMLSSTYDYSLVSYSSPTLISIRGMINEKYAVKSGSTDTDYWTIGYNKDNLVMVWAGNDDNSNVKSNDSRIVKKIWASTISSLPYTSWYEIPDGVSSVYIDPISGELTNKKGYLCYYEKGTEPFHNDYNNTKEKEE